MTPGTIGRLGLIQLNRPTLTAEDRAFTQTSSDTHSVARHHGKTWTATMRHDRSFSAAEIEFIVQHKDVKTDVLARMVSRQFKTCRTEKSVSAALYRAGVRKERPQRQRVSIEQRIMASYPPNGA